MSFLNHLVLHGAKGLSHADKHPIAAVSGGIVGGVIGLFVGGPLGAAAGAAAGAGAGAHLAHDAAGHKDDAAKDPNKK